MARKAQILCHVKDYNGETHAVREIRPTAHGFDVYFGWPATLQRGQGAGGPRIIITPELAKYLFATRLAPGKYDLPVGKTVIKKCRKELELNWFSDRAEWWLDNPTGPGKKASTVSVNRKKMGLESNTYWTPDEDEMLIALYQMGQTVEECVTALMRTTSAVLTRLSELRQEGRVSKRCIPWTEDYNQKLTQMLGQGKNFEECAKALQRTVQAVIKHAQHLRKKGLLDK